MNAIGALVVDGSILAHIAQGSDVPLHLARRALKRLADMNQGEHRFLERFFGLGPEKRAALLDSIAGLPPPAAEPKQDPMMTNTEETQLLKERVDVAAVEYSRLLDGAPIVSELRQAEQRILDAAAAYGRRARAASRTAVGDLEVA